MSRLNRHKRDKETPEVDVTTFLNLMVVLIPFLLVTAVFSRITVMELNLPTSAGGQIVNKPAVTIEVIVRKTRLEIGDSKKVVVTIPMLGTKYDLGKLSESLMEIKNTYSDKQDATVLVEPDIEYDDVIHVMDAVRSLQVKQAEGEPVKKIILFPEITIGAAP
jgi:biopolymer transport protein ExbD